MRSKLKKIGFEIEGEFTDNFMRTIQNNGGEIVNDGSVCSCNSERGKDPFHVKYGDNCFETAEYNSEPILVEDMAKINAVFDMFSKAYQEGKYHWNKSAGFHIHTSYSPSMPPELRWTGFTQYALAEFIKAFPDECAKRFNNSYSNTEGLDQDRFLVKPESRYKAINFCSVEKHGTLEFRLWPANDPEKMRQYCFKTIEVINNWLNKEASVKVDEMINDGKPMESNFSVEARPPKVLDEYQDYFTAQVVMERQSAVFSSKVGAHGYVIPPADRMHFTQFCTHYDEAVHVAEIMIEREIDERTAYDLYHKQGYRAANYKEKYAIPWSVLYDRIRRTGTIDDSIEIAEAPILQSPYNYTV